MKTTTTLQFILKYLIETEVDEKTFGLSIILSTAVMGIIMLII